ncbi:MAG TPA: phosphatidylglycerophosphatase A [Thermoanaerobaculaceae bacterium]|nr:phosphatidylglycerophosphatase A [Thermoanaerobaculaceae bacterium]
MRATLARVLATVGGLGDVLPAPGTTVGSLAGAAVYWAASALWPTAVTPVALAGLVLVLPVSVWASGEEARRRGVVDPHPVVIDEVAGQWAALATVALVQRHQPGLRELAAGFLLFRIFDVLKPWPIRRLERLPGGWGIVADDIAAGVAAGAATLALLAVLAR